MLNITDTTEVARTATDAEAAEVFETGNGENSTTSQEDTEQWILYVDGASIKNRSRAGMIYSERAMSPQPKDLQRLPTSGESSERCLSSKKEENGCLFGEG